MQGVLIGFVILILSVSPAMAAVDNFSHILCAIDPFRGNDGKLAAALIIIALIALLLATKKIVGARKIWQRGLTILFRMLAYLLLIIVLFLAIGGQIVRVMSGTQIQSNCTRWGQQIERDDLDKANSPQGRDVF